jgi:hypothetical protein
VEHVSEAKTAVASREARARVLVLAPAVKVGVVQAAWRTQHIMTLTRVNRNQYFIVSFPAGGQSQVLYILRRSNQTFFPLSVASMEIPKSLFIVIALLIAGFTLSLTISMIRVKGKHETKYQKVEMSDNPSQSSAASGSTYASSYQNSDSTHYAIPPTQKVVTYCVIDGRLVDS